MGRVMKKSFHICTVVNRTEQYAQMRAAFAAARFSEEHCRFSSFDNTAGNRFDPYRLVDSLIAETPEPYLILCHQDVRPDLGSTAMDLLAVLEALDQSDPRWVIAGNAGVDLRGRFVLHLDDPYGRFRAVQLPRRVVSLDENFLVIRSRCGLLTSPDLSGFHLYATDLVLNARLRRQEAYVIDFPLTHLSAGNRDSNAFAEARERFMLVWRPRLFIGLIQTTTCAALYISCLPVVEKLLRRGRIRRVLWRFKLGLIPATARGVRSPTMPSQDNLLPSPHGTREG